VATRAIGQIHAGRLADQHPRFGAHTARHKHGLPQRLILGRQTRSTGAKSAGSAFTVHTDFDILTVDVVSFNFAHVVGDIIDGLKFGMANLPSKDLFKGLTGIVSQNLAVTEGVISSSAHGRQVSLTFR